MATVDRSSRVHSGRFLAIAGTLVIGGFLLRIAAIGDQELWVDEAFSFYVATTDTDLFRALLTENSPPLYYLLLRLWVEIAGTSETELRLLSAIFGTLFVAEVIWAGTTFFNRPVALWAGAFAAIAPIHIYYSQEARTYSLLVLLILLTYIVLWRAVNRTSWHAWALVAFVATLAIYSHYFAVLALAPTVLVVWSYETRRQTGTIWMMYGLTAAACGLLVSVWVAFTVFLGGQAGAGTEFFQTMWNQTPPALAIPKTLELFGLGSHAGFFPPLVKAYPLVAYPQALRFFALGVLMLLGVWVAVPWMDNRLQIPELQTRKAWVWAMLAFPLAALWLISEFITPLYIVGRYDFIAFPAYVLLVGLALAKTQAIDRVGPMLVLILSTCVFVPIGVKLIGYYDRLGVPSYPSARAIGHVLGAHVQDGDVVVFTGLRGVRLRYYLSRLGIDWRGAACRESLTGRSFACRMYPRETERHPAMYDAHRVMASSDAVQDDAQDFVSGLNGPHNTVWVVMQQGDFNAADPALLDALGRMGFQLLPAGAETTGPIVQGQR